MKLEMHMGNEEMVFYSGRCIALHCFSKLPALASLEPRLLFGSGHDKCGLGTRVGISYCMVCLCLTCGPKAGGHCITLCKLTYISHTAADNLIFNGM